MSSDEADTSRESQSGAEHRTPKESRTPNWPHAPTHRLAEGGTFIVTAGTYRKAHLFAGHERLAELHDGLLRYAAKHGWRLEAWAVFPNHYHFVGHSPELAEDGAGSLRVFLANFHQNSASWVNGLDGATGRKVWHNFWETRLTYEKSFFARLSYVHQNAVKHRLVPVANQYRWCSAAWFEREAEPAMVRSIYGFKTDRVNVLDDF
ncbi:MAG: transposase [Limisphaerales bacterium]